MTCTSQANAPTYESWPHDVYLRTEWKWIEQRELNLCISSSPNSPVCLLFNENIEILLGLTSRRRTIPFNQPDNCIVSILVLLLLLRIFTANSDSFSHFFLQQFENNHPSEWTQKATDNRRGELFDLIPHCFCWLMIFFSVSETVRPEVGSNASPNAKRDTWVRIFTVIASWILTSRVRAREANLMPILLCRSQISNRTLHLISVSLAPNIPRIPIRLAEI